MKATLCFAAIAASLAIAPMAVAQTYESGVSRAPAPEFSGASGRTDSPAVKSLSGVDQERWREQNLSRPNRSLDRRAMDRRAQSGSTGGAAINRDATGASDRSSMRGTTVDRSDISSRRGRGQNDLELSQTSLLNQFSAAGYTMVRDFRKDGDRYIAQAQDRNGRWASVELDPRSGTITPR